MYKFDHKKHLHTLNDKPLTGTSSVVGVLSKPLTWWASGLAVEKFGWLDPKKNSEAACKQSATEHLKDLQGMLLEDYRSLLANAYKAHSVKLKSSAEKGTDLHEELEKFVKAHMKNGLMPEFDPKIKPFMEWSDKHVKKFLWSEAHCYSRELFVGGITDAGAELNNGQIAILDFKSSKEAYLSQFIQIAGYSIQVAENGLWDSQGKFNKKLDKPIDVLIVVPFGASVVEPVLKYNVQDLEKGFINCLELYRLLGMDA